jgi:uncharacterized surface protein with fasciclin (FAS1) repeats
MRLKPPSLLVLGTAGVFLSFLAATVHADLTYYVYTEEEEQSTTNEEATIVVLRSVGSLPLDKSTFSTTGDACPEMVWKAGGINPRYLCAGPAHPDDHQSEQHDTSAAFFPIAPGDSSAPGTFLPFRFSAFQQSQGTPSGLLVWRNSLVVDLGTATSEDQPQFLDAMSMGIDTSKDSINAQTLASYSDGETIAKYYLLTKEGGEAIVDGGTIRIVKGKPKSSHEQSANDETTNDAAAVSLTQAPQQPPPQEEAAEGPLEPLPSRACQSIAETICDDENNDKFGTLCSLMIQVGLDKMLSYSKGTMFTLFAPVNDGFTQAFSDKPQPSLLSGHDLTKLLLSHVIVTGTTESAQSLTIGEEPVATEFRYEDMVCGAKTEMASGWITKTGCDANATVSYVLGPGNGKSDSPRPKFLDVDHETCNGMIHTLDYVILPGDALPQQPVGSQSQLHHHGSTTNGGFVNIGGGGGGSSVGFGSVSSKSRYDTNVRTRFDDTPAQAQAPPQQIQPQQSPQQEQDQEQDQEQLSTNTLDESEVMAFFQQQKQDLLEQNSPWMPPTTPTTTATSTTTSITNTKMVKDDIDITIEPTRTESAGFLSFFGRTRTRPGNLRRR